MRRNIYIVSSLGVAIIIGALVIGAGIMTVHSQAGKPMGADDYSRLKHEAEDGFFWVPDDQVYRELNHREWWGGKLDPPRLVAGGFHSDGTEMFVCRGIVKRDEAY